ncbi:MAG: hypothetical protein H0U92_09605 [Actinobacteria bacterium]|nr:hypothetical protein [Actinomycetota bacterium]
MREPDAETTVSEAIDALRVKGYDADFSVSEEGLLRCGQCGHLHAPEDAVVNVTYRFEGASDPDDEAVILGLTCGACGSRGVLVAAYGPSASPEDAAVVAALGRS